MIIIFPKLWCKLDKKISFTVCIMVVFRQKKNVFIKFAILQMAIRYF